MDGRRSVGASEPRSAYATVNGQQLYYEISGRGRSVVLLHGGGLTIDRTFGPMVEVLAQEHRVIGVELQGHGHTADTPREMRLDLLVADVEGLLHQLEVERTDVFGFSLGGMVGLGLALGHPDLVDRLVVASAPYRADGFHAETRPSDPDPASKRMPTAADGQVWEEDYRSVAPDPDGFAGMLAKTSGLVGAFEGWSADELRGVRARTLVLVGDTDFVRLEHAVEMVGILPDGQLAVLPGATHMDITRRPDQVLAMVLPFLDGE